MSKKKQIYVLEYEFEIWGNKGGSQPHERLLGSGDTFELTGTKEAIDLYMDVVLRHHILIDRYTKAEKDDEAWKQYETDGDIPDLACAEVKLSLSTDGGVVTMATYEASAFRRD